MRILKQSTTYTLMFLMVDSADHYSAKTGLTVTVTISKAGGSFGAAAGSVSEVSAGWYKISLTTDDTDTLGDLAFHCTGSGADPTDFVEVVSARKIDDLAYPATSGRSMVVDASGLVDANMVKVGPTGSGTAQTAGNLADLLTTLSGYVDTEVAAILAAVDTEVAAIKAKTDNLPASPAAAGDQMALTNAAIDAILDRSAGVETGYTVRQALRIMLAVMAGKLSGAATSSIAFRDMADSKNRVVATVDSDGNRSAVTLDAS